MNVLLIQDVDNLGYAGDVKKVANGYGRNYLIPQQMAVVATPGALKQADTIRKTAEKRRAQETADAQAVANQIADLNLSFERRAGETGKLYGSVTSAEIAESILAKTGIEIDRRKVALPEPIRSLGEMDVTIKLMIDVSTNIKVTVTPEGGILEKEHLEEDVDAEDVADVEVETIVEEEESVAEEEESVAEEVPAEEAAGEEAEAPAEEAPSGEAAVEEAEAPAEEAPSEETSDEAEADDAA